MSIDRARSDLAFVEAEISELLALLQEKRERAEKLRAFIELASEYETLSPASSATIPVPAPEREAETVSNTLPESSPFYGKSLGAAGLIALEQANEPMTAGAIVKTLKEAGWQFVSSNPSQAIYWALRKTGEAVTIAGPKWALTEWRPNHVAKSSAGLKAARQRGVQLGPPKKMTDDKVAQMKAMIADGVTGTEIAKRLGVSRQTAYRYIAYLKESIQKAPGQEYLGPNVTRLVR